MSFCQKVQSVIGLSLERSRVYFGMPKHIALEARKYLDLAISRVSIST
jgi:hypothetical protein